MYRKSFITGGPFLLKFNTRTAASLKSNNSVMKKKILGEVKHKLACF